MFYYSCLLLLAHDSAVSLAVQYSASAISGTQKQANLIILDGLWKCVSGYRYHKQGYRYHKLRKPFSKFYRRHYELISKYNVGLKTLLS